jgi:hypothetical protein
MKIAEFAVVWAALAFAVGCGSGGSSRGIPNLTLSLGKPATVTATFSVDPVRFVVAFTVTEFWLAPRYTVAELSDRTVNSPSDNNGPGSPRSVLLDVSALGTFTSGTLVTIDSSTSASTGPTPVAVTPAAQITLTLNGYSVAFLTLKP